MKPPPNRHPLAHATDPRDDYPTALTYLAILQAMQAQGRSETTLRRRVKAWGIPRARGTYAVDAARRHALSMDTTHDEQGSLGSSTLRSLIAAVLATNLQRRSKGRV